METLKKYFWLFSGLCTVASLGIMCFVPLNHYSIAGIIVCVILAIIFAYLCGKNKGQKDMTEILTQENALSVSKLSECQTKLELEIAKNKPFPDSLFQYFDECKEKKEYEEIIRFGSGIARPLWLSQKYEARLEIGRYIFEAASETTPENYEKKVKAKIDYIGWTYVELELYEKAKEKINYGIHLAKNSTDEEFNEKYKTYYIAKAYRHLFGLYFRKGKIEKSKEFLRIAVENTNDIPDIRGKKEAAAEINYSESLLLTEMEEYDEALLKIQTAKDLYEELGSKEWLIKIDNQKAEILIKKGDENSLNQAADIIHDNLKKSKQHKFMKQYVRSFIAEGHFYYKKRNLTRAKKSFNDGLLIAERIGMKYEKRLIDNELRNIDN